MGKVLVFILGAAILLGVAWVYTRGAQTAAQSYGAHVEQEHRQLENVRSAAKRIEAEGQQRADQAAQEPAKE